MMEINNFKKLIEKGWNLQKISKNYGCSSQWVSFKFKNIYGLNYREYKKKARHEEKLKETAIYKGDEVKKIFELIKDSSPSVSNALEKLFSICRENNTNIKVKIIKDRIKEVWAGNKAVFIKNYRLEGKTSDEKKGYYRFRPPVKEKYDFLMVVLEKKGRYEYYIIPYIDICFKKSVNLPILAKIRSKYSVYKNNWSYLL